ncbi:MAG: hypothetical protein N2316_13950 [Spirochaetes bacterium]|nr:hypothetical protein [Spirochaetota bacterium]
MIPVFAIVKIGKIIKTTVRWRERSNSLRGDELPCARRGIHSANNTLASVAAIINNDPLADSNLKNF